MRKYEELTKVYRDAAAAMSRYTNSLTADIETFIEKLTTHLGCNSAELFAVTLRAEDGERNISPTIVMRLANKSMKIRVAVTLIHGVRGESTFTFEPDGSSILVTYDGGKRSIRMSSDTDMVSVFDDWIAQFNEATKRMHGPPLSWKEASELGAE